MAVVSKRREEEKTKQFLSIKKTLVAFCKHTNIHPSTHPWPVRVTTGNFIGFQLIYLVAHSSNYQRNPVVETQGM